MMKKKIKGFLFGLGLFVSLTCVGEADVYADTLTMTIERFTLGGGFIVEPEVVEFTSGENYAEVLTRVLEQKGLSYTNTGTTSSGFYLSGIRGVGITPDIPSYVQDILDDYGMTDLKPNSGDLMEKDYTEGSGWTYTVNDVYVDRGMSQLSPQQGDVARFMYTLTYGADVTGERRNGVTNAIEKTYYYTADKSDLIRKMGEANQDRAHWQGNSACQQAYNNGMRVLENLITQEYGVSSAITAMEEAWKALDATPTPTVTTAPAPQPTVTTEPTQPTQPAQPTASPTPTPTETTTPTPSPEDSPTPSPAVTQIPTPSPVTDPTGKPETPTPSPKPDVTVVPDKTIGTATIKSVTSVAYNKLRITWTKAEGATDYLIYRSDTSTKGKFKEIGGTSGALTYVDTGLTPGRVYTYKVRATSDTPLQGDLSAAKQGKTLLKAPSVTVSAGKGRAVIKWKKADGAAGYTIYRATSKNGKYQKVKTVSKKGAGSYTDKKVKAKKTYYYKVSAYCKVSGKKVEGSLSAAKKAKIKR